MFEFQEKILLRFPDTRKTTISQMHAMIDPIVNPNKPEIEMRIQHSMPSVVEFWGQGFCWKKYKGVLQKNQKKFFVKMRFGSHECTEVGGAFLIHFQKWFLDKVFIRIKIARKFKFYAWMVTSGSKSVEKCQKVLKKSHILDLYLVFQKKICLGWFDTYQ